MRVNIPKSTIKKPINSDSLKIILKRNMDFFADTLLKGNRTIIQAYMSKYQVDTCGINTYNDSSLKSEFEGIKIVKGINRDKNTDTVFVVPTFNYCDDGESYCFYDKTLPRLQTDSYCCHPENLFVIEDIDEDGTREIGIYYSSCASRYKSLRIYSLKNGQWKEIGCSTFDILTRDPQNIKLNKLVRKITKGKFKICNFIDGRTKWETITMK